MHACSGFQGCTPYTSCGRALATCSAAQAKAWTDGLGQALWALHSAFQKLGNKTIICNGTGGMYSCDGKTPCFCDAANKERFYPNENDLQQVVDAAGVDNGLNPFWGIIHVPHINDAIGNFNKSLAGFLATAGAAGTPFGFGVGFEYECEEGGWLRDFSELHKPLGPPAGPPKVSNVNITAGSRAAVFTRAYKSGVKVFYNSTAHPRDSSACIEWGDGSRTDAGGCEAMDVHMLSHAWQGAWKSDDGQDEGHSGTPAGGGCTVLGTATCYTDSTTAHTINRPLGPKTATSPHYRGMTQQGCAQLCHNQNKKLAGVEYGWQCYCGNALNFVPAPSTGCTMACPGNSGEKCGGADAVFVFEFNCTGKGPGPAPGPGPGPSPSPPTAGDFDWLDPCNLTAVANRSKVGFGWCDYSAPALTRAKALVQAMTLDEKARTMQPFAPPISRLRLPPLWTTDALHGAFSSPHYKNCTVFPQAVANAASFDREYLRRMARVAADETRAKTNGEYGIFKSQTYFSSNVIWTPVVNLCRDPRWGWVSRTLPSAHSKSHPARADFWKWPFCHLVQPLPGNAGGGPVSDL